MHITGGTLSGGTLNDPLRLDVLLGFHLSIGESDMTGWQGEAVWTGCTLCCAIVLPGRKSAFRAGFWPDCYRESTELALGRPSAGRRADFGAFPVAVRPQSGPEGRFPARKHYCVT